MSNKIHRKEGIWIFVMVLIFCMTYIKGSNADVRDPGNAWREEIERILQDQSLQIHQQNEKIQILEETVTIQRAEIDKLKENVSTLKANQAVNVMETSLLKKIILNRKSNSVHLSDASTETSRQANNMEETKMEQRKTQIIANNLGNQNVKRMLLPQAPAQVVAFYAYMSHLENVPGAHHMLVFDIVKTNLQNGYNGFTGIFTVPVGGVYIFTYTVRVACHSAISFEIVKNGTAEGSVYIDTEDPDVCDDDHATGTIVTSANQGDAVFIRTHSTYTPRGSIQSNQFGRCSFAGWLISGLNQ